MVAIRVLQSLATLDRGGAEAMIMGLYKAMDRKKIQFDFVVNDRFETYAFEEEVKQLGGRVFKVPKFTGKNIFECRREINTLFEAHPEWSIVHIHNSSSATLFLDLVKKHDMIPIVHAHFNHRPTDFRSLMQEIFRWPIKFQTKHLLACSQAAGENTFHVKKERVKIIHNAIETKDFLFNKEMRNKKRAELGLQYETVLGHVGRMGEEKNHLFLIDGFRWHLQFDPESVLLLIGTGELEGEIRKKVAFYNLQTKVKFLGVRHDVHELLQAIDIFAFPSLFEGLPVTLVEAQAAGLPIIASDTITREVEITDLITFVSLKKKPFFWAKMIDEQVTMFRENREEDIVKAGYDIKEAAKDLEDYYLSVTRDGD